MGNEESLQKMNPPTFLAPHNSNSRTHTTSRTTTTTASVSAHNPSVSPIPEENDDHSFLSLTFPTEECVEVVWIFWKDSVDILPRKKQLEVAVLLYTNMFSSIPNARRLFLRNDLQSQALKYLDMLGWLIRRIKTGDRSSLHISISRLGERHASWGVLPSFFLPMLLALHTSLSQSFPQQYTVRVKYCMEKVYWAATNVMTNDYLVNNPTSIAAIRSAELDSLAFSVDLEICLSSEIGLEYLARFCGHSYCEELMEFHLVYKRFRGAVSNFERDELGVKMFRTFLVTYGSKFLTECPLAIIHGVEKQIDKCSRKRQPLPRSLFDDTHGWIMSFLETHLFPKFVATLQQIV